jgi:hypothetical protein
MVGERALPGRSGPPILEARRLEAMRLTGERPMEKATPDSLLAFHDAGYREMAARLGPGTVLDIGRQPSDQRRVARARRAGRELAGDDHGDRRPQQRSVPRRRLTAALPPPPIAHSQ